MTRSTPSTRISNLNAESVWEQTATAVAAVSGGLHMSLKKRIWTGVQSTNPAERLRSLSWGARRAAAGLHHRPVATTAAVRGVDEYENLLL